MDQPLRWTAERTEAASLLAEGELTVAEICEKIGITDRTLRNWKLHPDFQAKVQALVAERGEALQQVAIMRRLRRARNLNHRYHQLLQIVKDRAADPALLDVPGGPTGLIVCQEKTLTRETVKGPAPADPGDGDDEEPEVQRTVTRETVREYAVDYALLAELRALEKQAAIEAGQWAEQQPPPPANTNVVVNIVEKLNAFRPALEAAAERERAGPPGPGPLSS